MTTSVHDNIKKIGQFGSSCAEEESEGVIRIQLYKGHTMRNQRLASLLFVLSLLSFPVYAQLAERSLLETPKLAIDLSCKHLYAIGQHYLQRHVNFSQPTKELEKRTIDQFIERLDGSKVYLTGADVKKIHGLMAGIFDKTKKLDCAAIEKAHDVFKSRVKERMEFAKSYLGPKFALDKKTALLMDPEKRKFPESVKMANDFLKKYIQIQVANYIASDMALPEAKEHVVRNYERIWRRVSEFSQTDLWSAYLDAFARSLDPHSSYLSRDALEDFQIQMRLALEGIGATLSSQDGFTVIEQLIPGGSADASGKLKAKDKIVAVGQEENGPFQNVIEMDLRDVVRLIRGNKGSKVRLTILRKEEKETKRFVVTLVRDKIRLEDEAASLHTFEREVNGKKKKIGLINLPSFYADDMGKGPSAAKDVKALLKQAREKNVDGIVLDLSTNGGGSLDDAVSVAGLFFRTGNVVKQSHRDSAREELELADEDPMVDYNGPLVVLVSRISASASEIVAGTLKDYRRAIIVGADHTFGKGTVQSVEPLPPGLGALKTTVGMFFTSGGSSTQHLGVNSDIVWPSPYSTNEIGEKNLDYSLPPKKIKPFLSTEAYVNTGSGAWTPVDPHLVKKLGDLSKQRVAKSEDFNKVITNLKKSEKQGHTITVADVLKEKKDKDKKEIEKPAVGGAENDLAEEGESAKTLTREEKLQKYLKRPDILEAVNVVADDIGLTMSQDSTITIGGAKNTDSEKKPLGPNEQPKVN